MQLRPFGEEEKRTAALLIERYGPSNSLRTLDAMQLAVMKGIEAGAITRVYCADRRFAEVVEREGFTVVDPERAPSP